MTEQNEHRLNVRLRRLVTRHEAATRRAAELREAREEAGSFLARGRIDEMIRQEDRNVALCEEELDLLAQAEAQEAKAA